MSSGATWWSGRLLRQFERLTPSRSWREGRELARQDRVHSLVVGPSGLTAQVDDPSPFRCGIAWAPFTDLEWEESLERLAFQDLSAAALLSTGRLPPHIEDFFVPSGRRLLPHSAEDLELVCSCSQPEGICAHLAATITIFAERLERDPWLLFLLRGRSPGEVQDALIARWNREEAEASAASIHPTPAPALRPLETDIDAFWGSPRPVEPHWSLPAEVRFPTVPRLGTPEPRIDEASWSLLLDQVYQTVSERARTSWREATEEAL